MDSFKISECEVQQQGEENATHGWCQNTPLLYAAPHHEGFWGGAVIPDCAPHVIMEGGSDAEQLQGAADLLQQLEQSLPAHQVECLGEVDEGSVQRHLLLATFLLELAYWEDHVDCRSLCRKAALRFWVDAVGKDLQSRQDYAGDVQHGYTPGCCSHFDRLCFYTRWWFLRLACPGVPCLLSSRGTGAQVVVPTGCFTAWWFQAVCSLFPVLYRRPKWLCSVPPLWARCPAPLGQACPRRRIVLPGRLSFLWSIVPCSVPCIFSFACPGLLVGLLDALVHVPNGACVWRSMDVLRQLEPVIVGTASRCLLGLASCNSHCLQVILAWDKLSVDDWLHLCDVNLKPVCVPAFLLAVSWYCDTVDGVSHGVPSFRSSSLWSLLLVSVSSSSSTNSCFLCGYAVLLVLTLLLGVVKLLWFQLYPWSNHGVVGVAISAVVSSGIADTIEGVTSGNDQIQLMPMFWSGVSPRYFVPCLVLEEGGLSRTGCGSSRVLETSAHCRSSSLCRDVREWLSMTLGLHPLLRWSHPGIDVFWLGYSVDNSI